MTGDGEGHLESSAASASRSRRRAWAVVGLTTAVLAAAALGLLANGRGTAEAVVYAYALRTGDTRTYDMEMSVDVDSSEGLPLPDGAVRQRMAGTLSTKVVEVHSDGSATIEMTFDLRPRADGADAFGPTRSTQRLRIERDGRIVSSEGSMPFSFFPGESAMGGAGSFGLFPTYPAEAVRPGDTWERSYAVPFPGARGRTVKVEGKHEGFENTRFGRAARIRHDVSVPVELTFPIGQFMAGFAPTFGQTAPWPRPLGGTMPEAAGAEIRFDGSMKSSGVSLVLPDGSELVEGHARMTTVMAMKMSGFPTDARNGFPSSMSIKATLTLDVVRKL